MADAGRTAWKRAYRLRRIIRRESAKAFTDLVIYGTSCVRIGADVPDLIQHVPIQEMSVPAEWLVNRQPHVHG